MIQAHTEEGDDPLLGTPPPAPWHFRKMVSRVSILLGIAALIVFSPAVRRPTSRRPPAAAQPPAGPQILQPRGDGVGSSGVRRSLCCTVGPHAARAGRVRAAAGAAARHAAPGRRRHGPGVGHAGGAGRARARADAAAGPHAERQVCIALATLFTEYDGFDLINGVAIVWALLAIKWGVLILFYVQAAEARDVQLARLGFVPVCTPQQPELLDDGAGARE